MKRPRELRGFGWGISEITSGELVPKHVPEGTLQHRLEWTTCRRSITSGMSHTMRCCGWFSRPRYPKHIPERTLRRVLVLCSPNGFHHGSKGRVQKSHRTHLQWTQKPGCVRDCTSVSPEIPHPVHSLAGIYHSLGNDNPVSHSTRRDYFTSSSSSCQISEIQSLLFIIEK